MRFSLSLALIGALALQAAAQDPNQPRPEQEQERRVEQDRALEKDAMGRYEARVFIRSLDNQPVDLSDATASLEIMPIDGTGPQTIAMERVDGLNKDVPPANNGHEPKDMPKDGRQDAKQAGLYGGQVKTVDNYVVELVLWDLGGMKKVGEGVEPRRDAEKRAGDQNRPGEPRQDGELPRNGDRFEGERVEGENPGNVAYFRAPFDAVTWWCGTRGHKTREQGGQCDIDSRPLTPYLNAVRANVHFTVNDESKVARDFSLPYLGSGKVLGKFLNRQLDEIDAAIAAEDFGRIRQHATLLRTSLEQSTVPAERREETLGLIRRIEDSAAARSIEDVKRSAGELRSKIGTFHDDSMKEHKPLDQERRDVPKEK